jgi:hypothetical protein
MWIVFCDLFCCILISAFCWFNPLNAELNPICHLLAIFGAHPILHVSRIRVKTRNPFHNLFAYFVVRDQVSHSYTMMVAN